VTTVAIVGAGIAGMGAAHRLRKAGLEVHLFDCNRTVGGDCFGVDVPLTDGGVIRLDAGVSDFNRNTFVRVRSFLDELGLPYHPINQSASFMTPDGATVWFAGRGAMHGLPGSVPDEIVRFRREAIEVVEDERYRHMTSAAYLDDRKYSAEFRRLYFDPRAAGAFPMPNADPATFPIRSMVAFWRMHGLVGSGPADRVCVAGGMHRYCTRFAEWFTGAGGHLHLGHRVEAVVRRSGDIEVRAINRDDEHLVHRADHVVIATNASEVLPLLEDPSPAESEILAQFTCQRARLIVHQDPRLMPAQRESWGAYNYVVARDGVPQFRPTITFYPNLLSRLSAQVADVFVTMNPFIEPARGSVIANRFFVHPVATGKTDQLAERVRGVQGDRNTWYTGSYLIEPFVHEQALESGQTVADLLLAAL
jgi:predicted NAD/FAD-binding protein